MFTKVQPKMVDSSSKKALSKNNEGGHQKEMTENPYEIYHLSKCLQCGATKKILRRWKEATMDEKPGITGNIIGVCVNPNCGYFRDIKKIKNWQVEDVEIPNIRPQKKKEVFAINNKANVGRIGRVYEQSESGETVIVKQELPTVPQIVRKFDRETIAERLMELGVKFGEKDTKGQLAAKLIEKLIENKNETI